MKKVLYTIMLLMLVQYAVFSQETAKDSVVAVVKTFFKAMYNSDTAMLNTTVAQSIRMQTIYHPTNKEVQLLTTSYTNFKMQIVTVPPTMLNEVIEDYVVNMQQQLATVWMPYRFYYDNKFSHCGINHFVLVKYNTGWKIEYIIDTREQLSCKEEKKG